MNFVTYNQLIKCIYNHINKLPKDIDLVVGIPRSGMLAANILALYLNLPFTDINSFTHGELLGTGDTRKNPHWIQGVHEAKHVLIVDDSISKGDAIKKAKEQTKNIPYDCKLSFCAIYALPTNVHMVDIYFEICNHPRMFEWNYMHHWGLEYSCVDIDGVLCEDPHFLENDDGDKYLHFLQNAVPKIIPTKPIGYLVTCRLEKYREATEQWLKKHNVQYDHLIMLECENAQARRSMNQGEFKARIYKNTNCFLFIESSFEQALEICKVSGRQVFCIENQTLITPDNLSAQFRIYSRDFRITLKRVIKKLLKRL